MVMFLFFCLASVGLTAIIVDGKIFQPVRNGLNAFFITSEEKKNQGTYSTLRVPIDMIRNIMTCYQCCGFWCGLICSPIMVYSLGFVPEQVEFYVAILACGFVGSFLSMLYLRIDELLFAKTMFYKSRTPPPEE
jgi:hypothetical protein